MQFQDKAAVRKGHLDDSLQAHQYLADVAEAESWLKEKEPIVTSDDYGKDEDSAQVNLLKLEIYLKINRSFAVTTTV